MPYAPRLPGTARSSRPGRTKTNGIALRPPAYGVQAADQPANENGLPAQLKSGMEALSGFSLDNVRVHYNSPAPAQLQARAFARGNEIHLGPGQEQHLPHEAWHVVQQAQGRVPTTAQMRGNIPLNDDRAWSARRIRWARGPWPSRFRTRQSLALSRREQGSYNGRFWDVEPWRT